jgi:hypothetical protein
MKNFVLTINFLIFFTIETIYSYRNKNKLRSKIQYKQSQRLDLSFEYPYSCGTWFNRGKNTIQAIKEKLEGNNYRVISDTKAYHMGEFPKTYNGFFNIYINNADTGKILVASSDENSKYYHSGLKYFAYTFYKVDETNGERNYYEDFPQKQEMLDFVLKRIKELNSTNGDVPNNIEM